MRSLFDYMLWGSAWGQASKARLLQLHSAGGVLLAAGAQLAGPLGAGAAEEGKRTLKVENLNTFQKAAQKSYFQVCGPLALPGPWSPARLKEEESRRQGYVRGYQGHVRELSEGKVGMHAQNA